MLSKFNDYNYKNVDLSQWIDSMIAIIRKISIFIRMTSTILENLYFSFLIKSWIALNDKIDSLNDIVNHLLY